MARSIALVNTPPDGAAIVKAEPGLGGKMCSDPGTHLPKEILQVPAKSDTLNFLDWAKLDAKESVSILVNAARRAGRRNQIAWGCVQPAFNRT